MCSSDLITRDVIRETLGENALPVLSPQQTISQHVATLLRRAAIGELRNAEMALEWDVGYELYRQAMELSRGNQAKAAKWLGVSRPTMRKKLALYGLLEEKEPPPPTTV